MGEFVKGWRRKAGCVLLVISAILTGGWVRSFGKFDLMEVYIGNGEFVQIASAASSVGVGWQNMHYDCMETVWQFPEFESSEAEASPAQCFQSWGWQVRFASLGFVYCVVAGDDRLWAVPYCVVVLPLTLLAAYLILWPGKQPRTVPQP